MSAGRVTGYESDETENNIRNYDDVDHLPKNCHITIRDILSPSISIVSHIVDIALDVNLAYTYYASEEYDYCKLTVLFILLPALVNTVISTRMYVGDETNMSLTMMATKRWVLRIFVLVFQLAPVLRYCDSLMYALKARKAERHKDFVNQRKYYELMVKEDSDVALLRLFECFLEAAPQQVLQIAIILTSTKRLSPFIAYSQLASVASSLLSMGWSMASYQRIIRFAQENKDNITWPGMVLQFLWHFTVTVSRILSISVATTLFPRETALACTVHWLVMTTWLSLWERTRFCASKKLSAAKQQAAEILFCSVLGLVYIFTYVSPRDGRNRVRYAVYYTVCFVENILAVSTWATADVLRQNKWYFYPLLSGCVVPFLFGIGFMLLYYRCFHPRLLNIGKHAESDINKTRQNNEKREEGNVKDIELTSLTPHINNQLLGHNGDVGCGEKLILDVEDEPKTRAGDSLGQNNRIQIVQTSESNIEDLVKMNACKSEENNSDQILIVSKSEDCARLDRDGCKQNIPISQNSCHNEQGITRIVVHFPDRSTQDDV